jgi:hypothetical protein
LRPKLNKFYAPHCRTQPPRAAPMLRSYLEYFRKVPHPAERSF